MTGITYHPSSRQVGQFRKHKTTPTASNGKTSFVMTIMESIAGPREEWNPGTTSSGVIEDQLPRDKSAGWVDQPPPVRYNLNREPPEKPMGPYIKPPVSYADLGQPCHVCGGDHSPEEHQATAFTNQVMGLEATNPDPVVTRPRTERDTFGFNWSDILRLALPGNRNLDGAPGVNEPVEMPTAVPTKVIPRFEADPSVIPWGPDHPHWAGGA